MSAHSRPARTTPEVRRRWLQDATPAKQSPAADEFVQPQSGFGKLVVLVQIALLVLFGLLVDQEWSQVCPNGIAEVCGVPSSAHTCLAINASAEPAPDCTFTEAADCGAGCTYTAAVAHDPAKYAAAEQRYYKIYLDVAIMMLVRDVRCLRASLRTPAFLNGLSAQVGFGYLMTFLQHYGLGAVGFTVRCLALAHRSALTHRFHLTSLTS